jgi:hypothetical protein
MDEGGPAVAAPCLCATLPDLALVPMGGDGLDERVFATVEHVCDHGGALWWLYLSKCGACGQNWMIAQEERIYDINFLSRLSSAEADAITAEGRWPDAFLTYERVLRIGRAMSHPWTYLERLSPALVVSAADLRRERADISVEEIADLLGVTRRTAIRLLKG